MSLQTTTFNYSIGLLKKSFIRIWKHTLPNYIIVIIVYLLIIIFIESEFLIGIFSGGIIFTTIQLFREFNKSKLSFKKLLYTRVTTAIVDQGYTITAQETYPWSDMKLIYRYTDSWQVIIKSNYIIIIPIENIPLELQDTFLDKAQAAGCKIK